MIDDLVRAAFGIGLLARFDKRGFRFFGDDGPAAWRSFAAIAVVAPMYLVWTVLHWSESSGIDVTPGYVLHEALTYVGQWLLFPVVAWHIATAFDRQSRFAHFVCAYNWAAAFQNAAFLLLDLILTGAGAANDARGFFGMLLLLYLMGFGWFVARHALRITPPQAILVVGLDFVISLLWEALT